MFRIVTDTSANLPTAYLQQEHITIIPFTFHADGDEQACLDLNTFDAKTFYAQMRSGTKVSTSQIPPQRYLDVLTPMLEAGEDVLFVSMSSGISGLLRLPGRSPRASCARNSRRASSCSLTPTAPRSARVCSSCARSTAAARG